MSNHSQDTGLRLVFVHGAGEYSATWDAQTDFFTHAEAVNLPGHIPNEFIDNDGRNSVDDYARWLHDYLRAEKTVDREPRRAILVGHSMGAAIALSYALMYGEEFLAGMVLAGGGAKMRVGPQILEGLLKDYHATCDLIIDYSFAPGTSYEIKAKAHETMLAIRPEVAYGDFVACNTFDIIPEMGKLPRIPTLVIGGSEDKMMPPKFSQYLHDNIPGSRLAIMEGAGHSMHVERPQQFNRLLDEFIASLS